MHNLALLPTTAAPPETIGRLSDFKTQSPDDREMRAQLHSHRYVMFQHGVTVREIAETEGVDERQIYLSISHCETRLPKAEVMANRNFRNAMIAQRKIAEKYAETLSDLMDGKGGKNWHQRSKALEHFRKTVGLDAGGGVHVSVNTSVVQDGPRSFEEAMTVIRRGHFEAERERTAVQESTNSIPAGEVG